MDPENSHEPKKQLKLHGGDSGPIVRTASPAYDLTFSLGPNGEHQMDICGEARIPGRNQLLELADKTGIKQNVAAKSIDRIEAVSESWHQFIGALPIREKTLELIEKAVAANRKRLRK